MFLEQQNKCECVTQIRVEIEEYPALPVKWSLCRPQVWWFCRCTALHLPQSHYEAAEMHRGLATAFHPPQSHLCPHALCCPRKCTRCSSLHVYPPCSTLRWERSTPPAWTLYQTGSWESRLCPPTHWASLSHQPRNLETQKRLPGVQESEDKLAKNKTVNCAKDKHRALNLILKQWKTFTSTVQNNNHDFNHHLHIL